MHIPGIIRVEEPAAGQGAGLVVSVPHSGRYYPEDFKYSCPMPMLRQTEDSLVDELVGGAARHGAALVTALFPRALIDVNRAEDDLDPAVVEGAWPLPLHPGERTLQGLGLVRRLCRNNTAMYDSPLPVAEIERRLRQYYRPWHRALEKQLERVQRRHGAAWLLDCHSMPSQAVDTGLAMPVDFVLGDRDGSSCDPGFTALAARLLRDMGYRVALNDPYKGVEILRRHGRPRQGRHALQLEINRALYLDENTCEPTGGFNALQEDLDNFLRQLIAGLPHRQSGERDERLAAE